jgi:hypothetical protein
VADAALHDPPAFYHAFLSALGRCHYPQFPTPVWHICLRVACEADSASYCEELRRKADLDYDWARAKRRRGAREEMRGIVQVKCGRAPRERDDYRLSKSVQKGCDAFLESRGIPAGDFHAY